jgi:hypothetical protein
VRERGDCAVLDRWFRTEGGGLAGDQAHYRPVRTGEFIEGTNEPFGQTCNTKGFDGRTAQAVVKWAFEVNRDTATIW